MVWTAVLALVIPYYLAKVYQDNLIFTHLFWTLSFIIGTLFLFILFV